MQLQIRLAQLDDMPHILALQAHSLRSLSQAHYSREQIEALVRSQAEARMQAFDAGEELIYVGEIAIDESTVQMVAMTALMIRRSQIGAMYVHPDFVRQGIARQLLEVLEEKAKELNYRVLYVISSFTAVLFYQSMGYSYMSQTCIMAESYVIGCVNMAKSLTGKSIRAERRKQGFLAWMGLIIFVAIVIIVF
jgi:putative acetyltransferase